MTKKTRIALSVFVVALTVTLGFSIIAQLTMPNDTFVDKVVADCAKNAPFSKAFEADLDRFGKGADVRAHPKLHEYYCDCALRGPLQKLAQGGDLRGLSRLSGEEALARLGGPEAMQRANDACIASMTAEKLDRFGR